MFDNVTAQVYIESLKDQQQKLRSSGIKLWMGNVTYLAGAYDMFCKGRTLSGSRISQMNPRI